MTLIRPAFDVVWDLPAGWDEVDPGDGTLLRMAYFSAESSGAPTFAAGATTWSALAVAGAPAAPPPSPPAPGGAGELLLSAEVLPVDEVGHADVRTLSTRVARVSERHRGERDVEVIDLPIGVAVRAKWLQATTENPLWRVEYWVLLIEANVVLTLSARGVGAGVDGDSLAADCSQVAHSLRVRENAAGAA